jgi:ABC-type uncharacterized transport system YnjBCD ATPase subunit
MVTRQKLAREVSPCPVVRRLGTLLSASLHRGSAFQSGSFTVPSVALARAVYAFTKYVLLDDPFSAVVCASTILLSMFSIDDLTQIWID